MRIGSLFSGYGGLDMAVSSVLAGSVAWHVEYDKAPSRILAHHYPTVPNYGDVTAVDFTTIEPVDVLTGGYPCQPFSHAGLRKGTDDDRHLWPHVLRAIREMGPRLAILENVRGHLSLGFDVVLSDLADLGWSARWGVVQASDAGAPHQRARLFIVAYPEGERERRGSADILGAPRQSPSQRGQDRWPDRDAARSGCGDPTDPDNGRRRQPDEGQRGVPVADEISADASDADDAARLWRVQPCMGARYDAVGCRQGDSGCACGAHDSAPDSSRKRHGRGQNPGMVGRVGTSSDVIGRQASPAREVAGDRGYEDAADAISSGRHGRSSDAVRGSVGRDVATGSSGGLVQWGDYGPAIARWERVIGRPAPAPTEPGRTGNPRLAPRFVEWMMGLPDGHVTDPAIGISRNDQLKALGNGVVPQQAALALRHLLAA